MHQIEPSLSRIRHATPVVLDGKSLDFASVVAVARHNVQATITNDREVLDRLNRSVNLLAEELKQGHTVYGVTTGFGGSADTRTNDYQVLQKALIQHHNSAVAGPSLRSDRRQSPSAGLDSLPSHVMPVPTVRAAMLTRCNSLVRGHSAVRIQVIQHILTLLAHEMTPVVPLRGSISASGDLTPLAYIAGALEGNPDIFITCGSGSEARVLPSPKALPEAGLKPLEFGPKEGLGLLTGTAFSCGAASLVLSEAHQLVVLAQLLTAMGTEAMLGNRRNYHPFISQVRPHRGQGQAAATIYAHLKDSRLAVDDVPEGTVLAQDRYAWRTAPQWMGPHLENMTLAWQQVQCEMNSTTDNPLVDPADGEVYHGGNFQAVSVTTAMEKTMSAMQVLGKMFFAQCSELINPMLSKGLPPNLSADNPNLSFAFKGVDINMAAYMSELAYLAHPVSNYVQSAEMHNQGLNSLALIAARYAGDTVEVLSLMAATYLYVICQALDLRALHREFTQAARPQIDSITTRLVCSNAEPKTQSSLNQSIWDELMTHWTSNSAKDVDDRSSATSSASLGHVWKLITGNSRHADIDSHQWMETVAKALAETYIKTRTQFMQSPTTKAYLCRSSQKMYTFVRETLDVPMHKGVSDHPTFDSGEPADQKRTIGSNINEVYLALRGGEMMDILAEC